MNQKDRKINRLLTLFHRIKGYEMLDCRAVFLFVCLLYRILKWCYPAHLTGTSQTPHAWLHVKWGVVSMETEEAQCMALCLTTHLANTRGFGIRSPTQSLLAVFRAPPNPNSHYIPEDLHTFKRILCRSSCWHPNSKYFIFKKIKVVLQHNKSSSNKTKYLYRCDVMLPQYSDL